MKFLFGRNDLLKKIKSKLRILINPPHNGQKLHIFTIFYKIKEEENNDRLKDLKNNLKSFKEIYSKAKDIIVDNKYSIFFLLGYILLSSFL